MSSTARLVVAFLLLAIFRFALVPTAAPAGDAVDQQVEEWMTTSRDAFAEGRWLEAVEPTRQLLDRFPTQQVFADRLARIYAGLDRPAEEAAAWEEFVRVSPTPEDACPAIGEAYWQAGDRARALDAFTRCRDYDPLAAEGWYFLGRAYQREGQDEKALETYAEGVRVDPLHSDSRVGLAVVLLRRNRVADARDIIEPAVTRVPGNPDVHLVLGLAEQRLGHRRAAREALERAAALIDTYADVHVALGVLEYSEGHPQEARSHFDRALAIDPGRQGELQIWLDRAHGSSP